MAPRLIPMSEIQTHTKPDDCWTIIHGKVYDLTAFLPDHPGGSKIILKYAGQDATSAFEPIHPADIIEKLLPPSVCLGEVDPATISSLPDRAAPQRQPPATSSSPSAPSPLPSSKTSATVYTKPPLSAMLNIFDFEEVARRTMRRDGWAYYSSGADDEITLRENHEAFQRIWFRPRVLVNVRTIDLSSHMLGYRTTAPFYVTATALGKLGHPDGEVVLTRAAATMGVVQMIPTLASCSLKEITGAAREGQVQMFQLYVNGNRTITEQLVKQAEQRGCKGLFITVDAPTLAKREKDIRVKFVEQAADVQDEDSVDRSQGAARAISSFIDPGLSWKDLPWLQSLSKMYVVLKGIQCGEDAVLAAQHGVKGIVVSNHGGRQLEYSRSGIETLHEVMSALRSAGLENQIEVYMDGGIRRGTDIVKAIALGAKAVGIGRPFLYAMSAYGQPGVERAMQILKDEMEMAMRLLGATCLADLKSSMVDCSNLGLRTNAAVREYLGSTVYETIQPPKSRL